MYDYLVHKFHEGGPLVMGSIFATLVFALAIVIERVIRYWLQYDLSNSATFMAAIQKLVMNNSIENAVRLCKKARPKFVPYVDKLSFKAFAVMDLDSDPQADVWSIDHHGNLAHELDDLRDEL